MKTAITPVRSDNFAEWYQQVIKQADLAENSPVRGCMVIKAWGYAIWEKMQKILDAEFEATGHENYYFPLFIPKSFLEREAKHVEGFAKECAVVTHHRLKQAADGSLQPDGELQEPLIVRPTSETIIGEMFSKWIQSHRDLPLLVNQWANIVRWEMRTRLFLRTSEFLWQEGHTAHATADEAIEETLKMLEVYRAFAEDVLAVPVITGEKTANERFPGAVDTYCIEAMMQDGKALQAGTSHFLGQNFSKTFNIKFLDQNTQESFVWTTSWGSSTRLIGALIMTHSDDDGLILPPRIAPTTIVIIPALHKGDQEQLMAYCENIANALRKIDYHGHRLKVKIDNSDETGGSKAWKWIKKGVPVRIEIGPRELENNSLFVGYRHQSQKDRVTIHKETFLTEITTQLDNMQAHLLERARHYRQEKSFVAETKEAFYDYLTNNTGFVTAYYAQNTALEDELKDALKVTARCIPLATRDQLGRCIFTGQEGAKLTVFAKAY